MPIKVRQNTGLTADPTLGDVDSDNIKGSSLLHSELDENFRSIWPVGSVYTNASNFRNPRDIIGFGVWQAFGRQSVLVGMNDSPANVAGTGLGASQTSTTFSRKINDANIIRVTNEQAARESGFLPRVQDRGTYLSLTFSGTHNFSVGQKITLSGLSGSTGLDMTREREILTLGDQTGANATTKCICRFDSPSSDSTAQEPVFANNVAIVVSNAAATLFGTRYTGNNDGLNRGEGGEISHNLIESEVPSHTHQATLKSYSSEHNTQDSRSTNLRGVTRNNGDANVELSFRGYPAGNKNSNDYTQGFAHENLMPYITAYMWIRIA